MKELLTALVLSKPAFTAIAKDRTNPHYKSKYSTLDSVLASVEPALHANGLVIVQIIEDSHLVTRLYHTSGQSIESKLPIPVGISDPQKLGSAITYYRRYSVCALLSVTADEDDDGNNAKLTKPAINQAQDKIESHKQAVTECMAELGWDKATKEAWSRSISSQPASRWTLQEWEKAATLARLALDEHLAKA
jgi:hypothetical protein